MGCLLLLLSIMVYSRISVFAFCLPDMLSSYSEISNLFFSFGQTITFGLDCSERVDFTLEEIHDRSSWGEYHMQLWAWH